MPAHGAARAHLDALAFALQDCAQWRLLCGCRRCGAARRALTDVNLGQCAPDARDIPLVPRRSAPTSTPLALHNGELENIPLHSFYSTLRTKTTPRTLTFASCLAPALSPFAMATATRISRSSPSTIAERSLATLDDPMPRTAPRARCLREEISDMGDLERRPVYALRTQTNAAPGARARRRARSRPERDTSRCALAAPEDAGQAVHDSSPRRRRVVARV